MKITDNTENEDLSNRWGRMLYLSNDLTNKTTFKEINACCEYRRVTLGYFFIKEHLNLLDATVPRAVATSANPYGGIDVSTAMFALIHLINKWFNAAENLENKNVYKLTNHVAKLLREHTVLDGIIYSSTKNPSENVWNIALVNQEKIINGYSDLYAKDHIGIFRKKKTKKCENYDECIEYTQEMMKLLRFRSIEPQWQALNRHRFP